MWGHLRATPPEPNGGRLVAVRHPSALRAGASALFNGAGAGSGRELPDQHLRARINGQLTEGRRRETTYRRPPPWITGPL
eukprot:5996864-Alexandrium_andersonii.AAC.1